MKDMTPSHPFNGKENLLLKALVQGLFKGFFFFVRVLKGELIGTYWDFARKTLYQKKNSLRNSYEKAFFSSMPKKALNGNQ